MMTHGTRRAFALLASMAVLAGAFAFLFGNGPSTPHGVQAAGGIPAKATSCIDIYQDILNNTPLGTAHQADDIPAASSFNRIEPSQTSIGNWDVTSVTYLGPDLVVGDSVADPQIGVIPGDAIPDRLATASTCDATTASASAGAGAAEAGLMHPRNSFANQYSSRPSSIAKFGTYDPTNVEDPAPQGTGGANSCGDGVDNGDSSYSGYALNAVSFDRLDTDCYDYPGTGANTLVTSGCAYSEAATAWSRTDTFTVLTSKVKKAANYGKSVLMLNTTAPTTALIDNNGDTVGDEASNPNECKGSLVITDARIAFPSVLESFNRTPTTDFPCTGTCKNDSIATDASGLGSNDGKANDWDGDGCTDWDELGKNGFTGTYPPSVTGTVPGGDPFNPNDCNQNYDSTMYLSVIVGHNTAGTFATKGNGTYYKCIIDSTDPKSGTTRTLAWRMGCYQDSVFSVVNTNYPEAASANLCTPAGAALANMCGDGQSGGVPPGAHPPASGETIQSKPYLAVDPANYPTTLNGTLNKTANTLTFSVCVATGSAPPTGPYIGATGSFDTRVMAGSFNITTGVTNQADCQDGPPYATGINVCAAAGSCQATLVELGSKKDPAGVALPATAHRNSDRDGCTDTQELRASAGAGGMRDPFNDWDYMNPTLDKQNRVDDILKVVGQYFKDDGDSTPGFPPFTAGYNQDTDRTAIPGGQVWDTGPPDGLERVDDILAQVKQYFHDCTA